VRRNEEVEAEVEVLEEAAVVVVMAMEEDNTNTSTTLRVTVTTTVAMGKKKVILVRAVTDMGVAVMNSMAVVVVVPMTIMVAVVVPAVTAHLPMLDEADQEEEEAWDIQKRQKKPLLNQLHHRLSSTDTPCLECTPWHRQASILIRAPTNVSCATFGRIRK